MVIATFALIQLLTLHLKNNEEKLTKSHDRKICLSLEDGCLCYGMVLVLTTIVP